MDFLFNEWLVGFGVPILIGLGFTLLADEFKEYIAARWCFAVSAVWIWGKAIMWSVFSDQPLHVRVIIVFLVCGLVGVGLMGAFRLATKRAQSTSQRPEEKPPANVSSTPSLIFVFGAPLGENDSPTWIMVLKHYGPNVTYNCDIVFIDEDRKNIEHQWLVEHPGSSFLPVGGVAGTSQVSFHISEAGLESVIGNFQWTPIDRNNQHYTISISCREGMFIEHWQVTRVDGVLRTKITIEHGPQWVEKNPMRSPVVFACTEPGFISTPLASAVPEKTPPSVNPGWKPNHRFDFPVAIIDPNGNVQVLAGVKLPDGSEKTDFGCWNMLTKHFGDD